jgi:hypothetical protein
LINFFLVADRFFQRPRPALAASRARRPALHERCDSYRASPDTRRSARAAGKTTAVDSTCAAPRLPLAIGAVLEDGERQFRFSPAAGCRPHGASVDAPLISPATLTADNPVIRF